MFLWRTMSRQFYIGKCIFCNKKSLKKLLIKEAKFWKIVANKYPFHDNAIVIILKRHIEDIYYINGDEFRELLEITKKLKIIWNKVNPRSKGSFNLYLNNGKFSGATINHIHFHFIPRGSKYLSGIEVKEGLLKVSTEGKNTYKIFKETWNKLGLRLNTD